MNVFRKPGMHIIVALAIPAVLFGGIGLAKTLGLWKTAGGSSAPARIAQGDYAGLYDPADIRGSSSFASIETFFGVPAALTAQAFGFLSADPGLLKAKDVDGLYGELHGTGGELRDVGTDAVKLFVARLTGLPFVPEKDTGLPQEAIDIILTFGAGMDTQTRDDLVSRAVPMRSGDAGTGDTAAGTEPLPESAAAPATLSFTGRTSFGEVMAAGLSKAQIEGVLGRAMPPSAAGVKDFCDSNGLSYGQVKAELLALLGN